MSTENEDYKLTITDDNLTALLQISRPRRSAKVISAQTVFDILSERGFSFSNSHQLIENQLWEFMKSNDLTMKLRIHADQLTQFLSRIHVFISSDEMKAYVSMRITPELGSLSYEVLLRILKNSGVVVGIQEDVMKELLNGAAQGTYQAEKKLIAQGIPEIIGSDGFVDVSKKFDQKVRVKKSRINISITN